MSHLTRIRTRGALGLGATLLLVTSACSSEGIAERVAEEAARAAGAGDVNVDIDGDGGSVGFEGEDGTSMRVGGDSLPPSFPDDLPLPDDYGVVTSSETSGEDGTRIQLAVQAPGRTEDIAAAIGEGLAAAGWEITETRRDTMSGMTTVRIQVTRGDQGALISVTSSEGEEEEVMVMYAVGPAPESAGS